MNIILKCNILKKTTLEHISYINCINKIEELTIYCKKKEKNTFLNILFIIDKNKKSQTCYFSVTYYVYKFVIICYNG